eukprot:Gregarina_sp_Pseudo_9__5339@NODE_633_length_2452_cov_19_998342_g597_i0_p3_GENE_NODE_633_length_2452_cov_19_998342_g597_i0NODE_633_length_2452_cov_19_998342_g597_i0_p3_ORF_typecomplete_len170_score54_71SRP19/PF01922_17/2_4e25_NODE_633_length_2452_cov_19_998342_g597_i013721881
MEKLLAGLGGGGANPLAALQQLAGGGDAMSRFLPNMDEVGRAMEAMSELDARPKYVCGPGLDEASLHETKTWIIVYPHYLDSTRTIKQGRRLHKEFAVPAPEATDIASACSVLRLRWLLEDKCYPRDFLLRGRVRIELFKGDKLHPANADVPNKRVLLRKLASVIANKP